MPSGLFVTGTDTGVGKTTVSAALMHRYRAELPLRYWKPIQTGAGRDDDTATVERLGACRTRELLMSGVRFPDPVSPHLAASRSGAAISVEPLVDQLRRQHAATRWIVEGAGGVLVPINGSETMVDLMARLGLPVVVVARTTLGTINHTLLTVRTLRREAVRVAGVVMVGDRQSDNRAAIEHYGDVEVLGEMPCFGQLTAAALAAWAATELDPRSQLLELLR